jgi:hypothetical protein
VNSGGVARCLIALGALAFIRETPAPPSSAETLFGRAVAVVENDERTPYAAYTVVVTVANDARRVVSSWQTTEDIRRGIVLASSFSEEERANPTTPHGANIVAHRRILLSAPRNLNPGIDPSTSLMLNSHPVNAERTGDVVGPVALAVDQNFGLTRPRAYRVADDERTMAASADELTIIGRTGTAAPRYRVALLDMDGGIAHLGLTPLRDPYRNRLREVWIATETAYVSEAIVEGVGDRAPFDRARWHVSFDRLAGATFITEVHSVGPLTIGGTSPRISIAFQNLNLLALSPLKATFGIEAPVRYLRDP